MTVTGSWLKHLAQRDYLTELEQKLNAKMKQQEGAACRLCEVGCPVPNPRTAIVIRDGVPGIGRGCGGGGACAEVCPEHIIESKARISFASLYEGK